MKKIFKDMGIRKFRQSSTFLFIICDIWILGYFYKKFTNKNVMNKLIEVAASRQGQALDKTHMQDFYTLLTQSLTLMLVLVAIVHLVTLAMYNKNKLSAFRYLGIYAWSGSLGCLFLGASLFNVTPTAALIFIAVAGCFLFNALGMRYYPRVVAPKKI